MLKGSKIHFHLSLLPTTEQYPLDNKRSSLSCSTHLFSELSKSYPQVESRRKVQFFPFFN